MVSDGRIKDQSQKPKRRTSRTTRDTYSEQMHPSRTHLEINRPKFFDRGINRADNNCPIIF